MWEAAASPQFQYKQLRQSQDRSQPHQTDRETVGAGETEREREGGMTASVLEGNNT